MPHRRPDTIKPDMSDYPCPGESDPKAYKAWKREYGRRFRALNPEYERSRRIIYNNSPEGKAWREAYENGPERKAAKEAYEKSLKGKATRKAYGKSAEWKVAKEAYENSAQGRAMRKRKETRRRQAESTIPLTEQERHELVILEKKRLHLTETTGIMHHLDHIVPLAKGGIHHPINCQVITAEENCSKSDKMTPEAMALIPQIQAIVHERKGWLNTEQDSTLADLFTTDEDET
jgi:hypothetical protein